MKVQIRHAAALSAFVLMTSSLAVWAPTTHADPAQDVMISTYLEGSGNNKAVELFNPTGESIALDGYTLTLYSNGSSNPTNTLGLSGQVLPASGYLVITHPSASSELKDKGDLSASITNFNGDDTLVLTKADVVVDSVGQLGFDPGRAWESNGVSTVDSTLVKKGCIADTDPSDGFDPAANFTAFPRDDISALRTFSCTTQPPGPQPDVLAIGAVQGSGEASPKVGQTVVVQGTVVGDFQGSGQFNGFYLQDGGDADPATSDGIFIYDRGANDVSVGDSLQVEGRVSEFGGQTQITPTSVVAGDSQVPATTPLNLPVTDWERVEGMAVTFPQALTIVEYYNFDPFGEIVYALDRQWTPTSVAEPGAEAQAVLAENLAGRLVVDDGRAVQNPTPAIHPNGGPLAQDNYFRGGDQVANLTGVISHSSSGYRLQPTQGADYTRINPRPSAPTQIGDLRIASFNVLNYFTTLTSDDSAARGADTPAEFARQQAKIVAAMIELDADILGLMEIENNGTAVADLVAALNEKAGAGTYAAVETGVLGSDAIIQAFIYKPGSVEMAGNFAAYDFGDDKNRHALTQTFKHKPSAELVTISVNHLKSKGSACQGDPDHNDGQGNCNRTRTEAATALVNWLATDPTGQGANRIIVMGDLNSYDYEDPIDAFIAGGYTDMEKVFGGDHAYSYVFNGMAGYLDYALANEAAKANIVAAQAWHINADESDLFDYDMSYKKQAEQDLFSPDPYRSSDHDPVVVDLQLATTPPAVEPATASPTSSTAAPPPAGTTLTTPLATTTKPGLPTTGFADSSHNRLLHEKLR